MLCTLLLPLENLKSRFLDQDGQDLTEYALVVGLLSCCAIAVERNVATSIYGAYELLVTKFVAAL
jgi:Flp pilus assembly pilin Flp